MNARDIGIKQMDHAFDHVVVAEIDHVLLDPHDRKLETYLKLGWDRESAEAFLAVKSNWSLVASFNTPTISFTSSSRINRFVEVFNSEEMLALDRPLPGAVEAFNSLKERCGLVVLTTREESLKEPTVAKLSELGFDLDGVELHFKRQFEVAERFRTTTLKEVRESLGGGTAALVTHLPDDFRLTRRFQFLPVAITTTHSPEDFPDGARAFDSWEEAVNYLGGKTEI